jgi:hypothetical protein
MKDGDIDFSDIPEKTDWNNAVVGKFYRPIKKLVTVRKGTNKKIEANNVLSFVPQPVSHLRRL